MQSRFTPLKQLALGILLYPWMRQTLKNKVVTCKEFNWIFLGDNKELCAERRHFPRSYAVN